MRNRISVNDKAAFAGEVTKPRKQDNVVDEAMPADGVRWRRSDMEMDVKKVIRRAKASRRLSTENPAPGDVTIRGTDPKSAISADRQVRK